MKDFIKVREKVEQLNVIDDTLFQKMAEDVGFCTELIATILGEEIKILEVTPQSSIKNLQGRSVILDALCEKEDGTLVNVEVQKSNNDNHQKRVRYNAACITANITSPGNKFEKVPNLVIIYIAKFDVSENNQLIYHVDRVIRELDQTVYNGMEEIYVNATVQDGSDVAELMKIFTEQEAYNYEKFPCTSKRKEHFKKSEEGARDMCEIVEEYAKEYAREHAREYANEIVEEYAKEGIRENELEIATGLLRTGMQPEKVASVMKIITLEDILKINEAVI